MAIVGLERRLVLVIRGQVAAELRGRWRRRAGGPSLGWDRAAVGGYPFRFEVVLDGVRASEPSGWGLTAPQVRAETYAYDLKHWIAYAPSGVVLDRPGAGASRSPAKRCGPASVDRCSLARRAISIEGLKLAFAPSKGARPFPLLTADQIDAHVRPAGPDETEFLLQMQGATLSPGADARRGWPAAPRCPVLGTEPCRRPRR